MMVHNFEISNDGRKFHWKNKQRLSNPPLEFLDVSTGLSRTALLIKHKKCMYIPYARQH